MPPLSARPARVLAWFAATCLAAGLTGARAQVVPLPAAPAVAQGPASTTAREAAALPDGLGWVVLERRAVRLLDAQGRERWSESLRAQHLDTRPHPEGLALLALDADTQQVRRWVFDRQRFVLRPLEPLPSPRFGVETLCAGRDAQGLEHVFLVAKDGITEQWVMPADARAPQARLLRRFALPPQVHHCRVDDARQWLYAAEPDLGVWVVPADAEGPPARAPVLLRAPYGPLVKGAGPLALLPSGLAVLDADGSQWLMLQAPDRLSDAWTVAARQALAVRASDKSLAWADGSSASVPALWTQQRKSGQWNAWPLVEDQRSTLLTPPPAERRGDAVPIVLPVAQTDPVGRFGDAADDPAIWRHPTDPARSRVVGTNKKQGLFVYDLKGRERQALLVGRVNNVDLRQDVNLDGRRLDIAVATQRDDLDILLFAIDRKGRLADAGRIPTGLPDIYGICLHRPPTGGLQVIVNDKDGRFHQYQVVRQASGRLGGTRVREFRVETQPEACVADDARERLFMGEEKRGVWSVSARADGPTDLTLVLPVGPVLQADVEGLGFIDDAGRHYLVVSSQGNSRFVVLDGLPPHAVRGSFRIGLNLAAGIDGVSETDGLEVLGGRFGPGFERGLLVVQDGYKRLPDGPQNFKLLPWEAVVRALGLP